MQLSFHFIGQIDPVALYAAVVATAVFVWDIVKWRQSGVHLKGYANSNMKTLHMGDLDDLTYISIRVNNEGDRPTTITGIYLKSYGSAWKKFRKNSSFQAVVNSYLEDRYPIPYRFEVGAPYTALILQTPELEKMSREMRLYAEVAFGAKGSLMLRIPPIEEEKTESEA